MTALVVDTDDLRRALVALRGHVPRPDWNPELGRIHAIVHEQVLHLTATNGYTSGIALVSILEHEDAEVGGTFNIEHGEISSVLGLFKAKKAKGEEMGDALRVQVGEGDGDLVITDVSGLFPGRSVTLPRVGMPSDETFPDVGLVVSTARHFAGQKTDRVVANASMLAAFETASRVYGEPLVLEPAGASGKHLLVSCAESFIGLMKTITPSQDDEARLAGWDAAWDARLPTPKQQRRSRAKKGDTADASARSQHPRTQTVPLWVRRRHPRVRHQRFGLRPRTHVDRPEPAAQLPHGDPGGCSLRDPDRRTA